MPGFWWKCQDEREQVVDETKEAAEDTQGDCRRKVLEMIEVRSIGSAVMLTGDVLATITAINITGQRPAKVSYQCVWWDGRNRCSEWVEAFEVADRDAAPIAIGFADILRNKN